MNRAIIELTLRQLLGKRRSLLLLGFALIPVGIALLYRFNGRQPDHVQWTANMLGARLIVGSLLPIAALIFGTAALGSEFEDGTAVYLLSKPLPRSQVVLSKLLVAWLATSAIVIVAVLVAGAIAIRDIPDQGVLLAFSVATVAGSLVYCSVFLLLSILTGRALITGLLYVFIWEGLVTALFSGTRVLSVRQYTIGIAKWLSNTSDQTFAAKLDGIEALALLVVVSVLAAWLAIRALGRWEIGESG
jgi:ABC-2 type transport system permease protein